MTRRYPKEFYPQRKRVLERDGYKCIVCHRGPQENKREEYWQNYGLQVVWVRVDLSATVDVHHVAYWVMQFGTGFSGNEPLPDCMLVTLCDSCHGKAGTCAKDSPFHKIIEDYVRKLMIEEATRKELENLQRHPPVGVV